MPRTNLSATRDEIAALLTGLTLDDGFAVKVTDYLPRPGQADKRAGIVVSLSAKRPETFEFVIQAYVDSGVGAKIAQDDLDSLTDDVDAAIAAGTGVNVGDWEISYDDTLEVWVAAGICAAAREDF